MASIRSGYVKMGTGSFFGQDFTELHKVIEWYVQLDHMESNLSNYVKILIDGYLIDAPIPGSLGWYKPRFIDII